MSTDSKDPEIMYALTKVKEEILNEINVSNTVLLAQLSSNKQLNEATLKKITNQLLILKNHVLEASLKKRALLHQILASFNEEYFL